MKKLLFIFLLFGCTKDPLNIQVGMMYHIKGNIFNKGVYQPKQPIRVDRLYTDPISGYPFVETTDMDNVAWYIPQKDITKMKWLIIFLFPVYVMAQDMQHEPFESVGSNPKYFDLKDTIKPVIKKRKGKWLQYALLTTSVVSNAIGDGLNSREKYASGHALNALSIASLIAVPFVCKPNWKLPVNYILIRYALFDGFYNYGAKRNINYRGGQNYYSEGIGHVPLGVLNTTKFLSLGASIIINIK